MLKIFTAFTCIILTSSMKAEDAVHNMQKVLKLYTAQVYSQVQKKKGQI
jgi:hypothetical protein